MFDHVALERRANFYRNGLALLLGLFVFRVAAQLVQMVSPVPYLPPFEAWQSGALPYPLLVLSQLLIIAIMLRTVWSFHKQSVRMSGKTGLVCLWIGGVYFAAMLFRLIAGFTFAGEHPWLGAHLPAFFHLVLASFLLLVGVYHRGWSIRAIAAPWVARLAYPGVVTAGIMAHRLLVQAGSNLQLATYFPVLVGALAITFLERVFPHKSNWLADRGDAAGDALYMILIQILLPVFLGFFLALTLFNAVRSEGLIVGNIWPHDWPLFAQMLLMLLPMEFFRYWLHRASHNWTPLWQLHAVHHSPHKLYWLNVGRFHPLEKAMHYAIDTLPFALMGVSPEILALNYVFYAINGFFQHCNIEMRMGFLNYIIAGPELHRWHHSKLIRESNNNYGNTLIIWDLLFASWFLPKGTLVGDIGLLNRKYPMGFLAQLKAPFIKGMDKQK